MVVCLSPGGRPVVLGDAPKEILLVGTVNGIFPFARRDGLWSSQETLLPGQHISALLFEPSSKTLIAGTYSGTLYTSKNLGKNWELRDQGLRNLAIFTLALQEAGGRPRIYAGTEPAHLFYSDDLGQSWTELPGLRQVPGVEKWTFPGSGQGHLKDLALDPRRPDTLYAAIEVGGLLKSVDGGKTWKVGAAYLNPDAHRVLFSPSNPERVYLVMPTTNRDLLPEQVAGVCVSHDGGDHWESLTPRDFRIGYVDPLVVHPRNESLMFVAGAKTGPGTWRKTHIADPRVARSRDGGKSWKILNEGLPEHIRGNIEAMVMDVWNDGFALFAGTTDGEVFYSADEGDHWQSIVQGIGAVSKGHHYRNIQASAA